MTDLHRETVGNVVLLRPAMCKARPVQAPRPSAFAAGLPGIGPAQERVETALARAALVRAMRDARDTVMPFRLFGEPAWELIIELFLETRRDESMPVAALCDAASCPERIGAQHLAKLIDAGLAAASPGWTDDEAATVTLTPRGFRLAVDIFTVEAPSR